ncbi:MAG: transcriptional repressor [Desulfarculus sp.]|nr:transcriptional repressor [Desulfarculus sp.]
MVETTPQHDQTGPPGLHQEERRQFERLLRQLRLDRIGDRLLVLEAFLDSEGHHSVEQWQRELRERGVCLEPAFVAQTLELLAKLGLAARREFEGGPVCYEHRHLGEHHDHLICTQCGGITEFHDPELEALQQRISQGQGFHPLRHKLQIYGLCHRCLATRRPSLPLALAAPGEKVRVERLTGGECLVNQLRDLGIGVGSEIEVISANGGPMVLAVKGSRVALGRGAAQRVLVSQAEESRAER